LAINEQISARIQSFTAELETLVRAAAVEAVRQALGGAPAAKAAAVRSVPAAKAAVSAAPKARARATKSAGGKRPPGQLAALVTKTGEWIKANPGHGVEDMAKALNVRTKELALPIQKLLAAKTIKKKGQKRATKYSGA
jgi:N-acetylmuramoyl-L-alanine amidase